MPSTQRCLRLIRHTKLTHYEGRHENQKIGQKGHLFDFPELALMRPFEHLIQVKNVQLDKEGKVGNIKRKNRSFGTKKVQRPGQIKPPIFKKSVHYCDQAHQNRKGSQNRHQRHRLIRRLVNKRRGDDRENHRPEAVQLIRKNRDRSKRFKKIRHQFVEANECAHCDKVGVQEKYKENEFSELLAKKVVVVVVEVNDAVLVAFLNDDARGNVVDEGRVDKRYCGQDDSGLVHGSGHDQVGD